MCNPSLPARPSSRPQHYFQVSNLSSEGSAYALAIPVILGVRDAGGHDDPGEHAGAADEVPDGRAFDRGAGSRADEGRAGDLERSGDRRRVLAAPAGDGGPRATGARAPGGPRRDPGEGEGPRGRTDGEGL